LSWNQQFFDPIELPGGRKLVTLRSTLSAAREMSVTGQSRHFLPQQTASPIANIDRPGAGLLCKFRSPKAIHQRPFCSHI